MVPAITPKVSFQTAPSPQAISWTKEDEVRIRDVVRDAVAPCPGSWQVTLIFSGVLSSTWVVECRRVEDGRHLRMLVDSRRPEDRTALRAAADSLGGHPRKEGTWPPARLA